MRNPITISILFSLIGIIALLPIFLIMMFVSPQELHYYNIFIIGLVLVGVLMTVIGIDYKSLKRIENLALLVVAIFTLTGFILFSKFWIDNKYGYSGWHYKNMWTLSKE